MTGTLDDHQLAEALGQVGDDPRTPGIPPGMIASPSRGNLDLAQIFNLVEVGNVVWFPPASIVRRHPRPGIAYRPVDDLPPLELALAWPQESRSPAVAAFVRTACAVALAAYPVAPASPTPSPTAHTPSPARPRPPRR